MIALQASRDEILTEKMWFYELFALPVAASLLALANAVDVGSTVTLNATVIQLNDTHVLQQLSNPYPYDIDVLVYDQRLREDTLAAAFNVAAVSGNTKPLAFGTGATFQNIKTAFPNRYEHIASNMSHTSVFDLTQMFDVPSDGQYSVGFNLRTRGQTITNGSSETDTVNNIHTPVVVAVTPTQVMRLAASKE